MDISQDDASGVNIGTCLDSMRNPVRQPNSGKQRRITLSHSARFTSLLEFWDSLGRNCVLKLKSSINSLNVWKKVGIDLGSLCRRKTTAVHQKIPCFKRFIFQILYLRHLLSIIKYFPFLSIEYYFCVYTSAAAAPHIQYSNWQPSPATSTPLPIAPAILQERISPFVAYADDRDRDGQSSTLAMNSRVGRWCWRRRCQGKQTTGRRQS